ncbi:two-component system OmpR family response regulator [Sphingomonas jinjuensis]|uniref:Regulatory protein VirG n=1 Tax=Sphingomonas jinjuensis TaxID=535907 RepID=A0A840FCG8_9SPHN|nr:response regulator transcription factor [Sphingomonas jinjuensis]MBB4154421.1 two-component system OmpR family response regulator [Sphingomonas jinjuensis]
MPDRPLIAVCEDDADIRELLAAFLAANGFAVATARDGAALDAVLAQRMVALVVLDWMLPGEDGLSLCRRIRAGGGPPVVMLTARAEDGDRIAGLDGGADDYVSKPFNPQVLLARIRAVLRRGAPVEGERLILADLAIDPAARRVHIGDAELSLTAAEFDLLLSFAQAPQRVLSRERLLDLTRGRAADAFDRSIDMQVSRLRRRLEEAGSEAAGLIRTVRNAGYILAAAVRRG